MKFTMMTTAAAAIACTAPALAQTARPTQNERPRDQATSQRDATPRFLSIEKILEAEVTNVQDRERKAELNDLIFDTRSGRAVYAIIDTNGILGSDDRMVALPYDALTWDAAQKHFTLRVTGEQLADLPPFNPAELAVLNDPGWRSNIRSTFNMGRESDEAGTERGDEYTRYFAHGTPETHTGTIASVRRAGTVTRPGTPDRSGTPARRDTPERPGDADRPGSTDRRISGDRHDGASKESELTSIMIRIGRTAEEQMVLLAPDAFLTRHSATFAEGNEITVTTVKAMNNEGKSVHVAQSVQSDGTTIQLRNREGHPAWETAGTSGRSFHMLASKLDDCTLHAQGKKLGNVDDVMIEVQSGTIAFMVISSGSTLGMGGDRHPVPFSAITHGKDKNMYVDMPSVRFDSAPKFTKSGTEELQDAAFAKRVCEFYGVKEEKFDTARASRWQQAGGRNPQDRQPQQPRRD